MDTKIYRNWIIFWIISFVIISFVIINIISFLFVFAVEISLIFYQIFAIISFFIEFIFLYLGAKFTARGHNFSKHPISFIGQTEVLGMKNVKALLYYLGFSITVALQSLVLGNIFANHYSIMRFNQLLGGILIASSVFCIGHGIIPYNITRMGHLLVTLLIFSTHLTANIFFAIYFQNQRRFGLEIDLFYQVLAPFQILLSIIYMIGYILDFKASLIQKFWIITSIFSLSGHIWFFSKILIT